MLSNRTHQAPPIIEDLGDGTYHYNFNIVHSIKEDETDNYDYNQVRCKLPIDQDEIQEAVNALGLDHIVEL